MNNIEAERGRHNLSKEALSRELGITSKTYRSYVNGRDIPSNILVKMSEMFNCSVDYLLCIPGAAKDLSESQGGQGQST